MAAAEHRFRERYFNRGGEILAFLYRQFLECRRRLYGVAYVVYRTNRTQLPDVPATLPVLP